MSRAPRGLSAQEAALWAKLTASVTPLRPDHAPRISSVAKATTKVATPPKAKPPVQSPRQLKGRVPPAMPNPHDHVPVAPSKNHAAGLDSHWERRLSRASTAPDFTLDLHGHTLDQAHNRLDSGLIQAKAMGARMVLVITGKPRPVDAADRGHKRGAIRAKILDWLAAGPHASDIAAIRNAHRRHGGDGALYLVLKRPR